MASTGEGSISVEARLAPEQVRPKTKLSLALPRPMKQKMSLASDALASMKRALTGLRPRSTCCTKISAGEAEEVLVRWAHMSQGEEAEEVRRLLAEGELLREDLDDAKVIEADVPRSGLGNSEHPELRLRRVLRALAAADPATGYCQSMNAIASVFIRLRFDEEATLKGTRTLLQECCPGYHAEGFPGLHRDVKVLGRLARKLLPERTQEQLKRTVSDAGGEVQLIMQYFLTLASSHGNALSAWPDESVARLWDLLFAKGSPALFASFLALLHRYLPEVHREMPEEEQDPPVLRQAFRQKVADCGRQQDFDAVLQRTREFMSRIDQKLIDRLRAELVR